MYTFYNMYDPAAYAAVSPYSMNPISAISGFGSAAASSSLSGDDASSKIIRNPSESTVKSAGRKSSPAECKTCSSRKYQDGSDENVSFKTAQHISPESSASRVRAHEQEHVSNAYTKAAKDNGRVLSAFVSLRTDICPECGRSYVSGGTTTTQIKYYNEDNPYQKELKSSDEARYKGRVLDLAC